MDDDDQTLDGNAAAGLLREIFGSELTDAPSRCAHCGNVDVVATMLVYTRAPGTVLRCSICKNVVLRVAQTPRGTYVDASGVAVLRMPRGG